MLEPCLLQPCFHVAGTFGAKDCTPEITIRDCGIRQSYSELYRQLEIHMKSQSANNITQRVRPWGQSEIPLESSSERPLDISSKVPLGKDNILDKCH